MMGEKECGGVVVYSSSKMGEGKENCWLRFHHPEVPIKFISNVIFCNYDPFSCVNIYAGVSPRSYLSIKYLFKFCLSY